MALLTYARRLFATTKCFAPRNLPVRNLMSKQLMYSQFGDPLSVVKFRENRVPELGSQEVLVRMLAAPVNPADINTIQGKYPVKVSLPSIAGNEGVGVVEDVGKEVQGISPGNKVIVTKPVQGTWRNYATFSKDVLRVVPDTLGVVEAATLTVNPCTAYRMLTDFIPVKDGHVVIQNGANGACGQNIIQICKAWGVKNIAVVRNRPDISDLKKFLEGLGATFVLTEEELRTTTIFKEKKIEKPALAINCVGGKSTTDMLRHVQPSGCMVTYGGMSREPVTIPTSAFIFKDLSFRGFWMTRWNEQADSAAKEEMMNEIVTLMCENKLKGPVHKMVKFDNYQEAVGNALSAKGFTGCCHPTLPCLPTIPGDEGVGDVVEIGEHVCTVVPGQRVVFTTRLLGTWNYYGIYHERDVHVIAPNIPLAEASMLTIAPCMAYRMLLDFRKLLPGQTIIQNAANSPCGQCVIQFCKAWGFKTINIVANHCGFEAVKEHLLNIGADEVYTLEQAEQFTCFNTSLVRPILALNCLGGRYEDVMLKLLEREGDIIYYGCAYDLPLAKQFLRSDATFYKFHLADWDYHASTIDKDLMLKEIIQLMVVGNFRAPTYEPVILKNYKYAFRNTVHCEAFSTISYIFDFSLP